MSRNWADFDFKYADKPCGYDINLSVPDPAKPCIGKDRCHLYQYCDLKDKKIPWKEPVKADRIPA